ncbi:ATP/GTP-binding protein [Actinacidiphila glaucinigra]|uniref:ATP/GTP-binding protein n=1 Tax=Actinacidiphila glaucinigra TaxID=235986 RepID=UPI0035E2B352
MADDTEGTLINFPVGGDVLNRPPQLPDPGRLFPQSDPSMEIPPESPEETTLELPPIRIPMSPESALASEGIPLADPATGGEGEDGGEYAVRRSLADRIGDWLEYRIAVGRARMEADAPYREAEIARKVALLEAQTSRETGLLDQQGKLRQAQIKAQADRASARGKADAAAVKAGGGASGLGADKGRGKGQTPRSPGSANSPRPQPQQKPGPQQKPQPKGQDRTRTDTDRRKPKDKAPSDAGRTDTNRRQPKDKTRTDGGKSAAGTDGGKPKAKTDAVGNGPARKPGGGKAGPLGGVSPWKDKPQNKAPDKPKTTEKGKGSGGKDDNGAASDRRKVNLSKDKDAPKDKPSAKGKTDGPAKDPKSPAGPGKDAPKEPPKSPSGGPSSGPGGDASGKPDKGADGPPDGPGKGPGSAPGAGTGKASTGDRGKNDPGKDNRDAGWAAGNPFGPKKAGPEPEWSADRTRRPWRPADIGEDYPDAVIVDDGSGAGTNSRPAESQAAGTGGALGLPRGQEPHTQRPGTTHTTRTEGSSVSGTQVSTGFGQGGLGAQHRTDITFEQYLTEMANVAVNAGVDKERADELAMALSQVADALRDMAADLVGDHNVSTEVTGLISELADAAGRMKQQAERCAAECDVAFEAAKLSAATVARVYSEDMNAVKDAGLKYASSAAHHD